MSFPCGLEHLRRCTGGTRWWSVDCGIISLGRFRLIGTYKSILYTPQSKSVTFVSASLLHSHAQLQTCLSIPSLHTYQWHPTPPMSSTLFLFIYRFLLFTTNDYPFPFLLFGATGRPMLSSEYDSPRTRHDLYTPTLLSFFQSPSFLPRT